MYSKCFNVMILYIDEIIVFLQKSFMLATESILDFLLRRLTANELNIVSI